MTWMVIFLHLLMRANKGRKAQNNTNENKWEFKKKKQRKAFRVHLNEMTNRSFRKSTPNGGNSRYADIDSLRLCPWYFSLHIHLFGNHLLADLCCILQFLCWIVSFSRYERIPNGLSENTHLTYRKWTCALRCMYTQRSHRAEHLKQLCHLTRSRYELKNERIYTVGWSTDSANI